MGKSTPKKYYAVCGGKDGFNGVLESWKEFQEKVHGVRRAKGKSFQKRELAVSFVEAGTRAPLPVAPGSGIVKTKKKKKKKQKKKEHAKTSIENPDKKAAVGILKEWRAFRESLTEILTVLKAYMETFGDALVVYTDGSCKKEGKRGARAGYGVYFGHGNKYNVSERLPVHPTSDRAEIFAVIIAIHIVLEKNLILPGKSLIIRTDSQVLHKILSSFCRQVHLRFSGTYKFSLLCVFHSLEHITWFAFLGRCLEEARVEKFGGHVGEKTKTCG